MHELPIERVLPELKEKLAAQPRVVLTAQPGAGKTTRVPLALLAEAWLAGNKIIMLEPRRLAARAVARYMAASLGEAIGRTVGYRVHRDTCVSAATRLEVVTEGVLTRMLQNDPALDGVGLVIFDEFHERNLHADLGLALSLESQAVLRPDLKLLVMSATLETEAVAALLGEAPVVSCEGRTFPVQTVYLPKPAGKRAEQVVAEQVKAALLAQTGDILVFLPGAGEIRRVERLLAGSLPEGAAHVCPLYGELSQAQQEEALLPAPFGRRKVVLATSIAETSLTVEGVRAVIDSGLMRVPRFSSRTGMTRLETVRVSRPSADQRRGRAGRLGPGVCWRLWTEREDAELAVRGTPEMLAADLAPLRLELAAWGTTEPQALRWLDAPPAAAWRQAGELLQQLGALDPAGKITAHGRRLNQSGVHPRLAHMVLTALGLGLGAEACALTALLGERDVLRGANAAADVDLRLRLDLLQVADCPEGLVDKSRLRRLRQEMVHWQRMFGVAPGKPLGSQVCGGLLALAYPDRIGQNRGGGRFLLSSGRGAMLKEQQPLSTAPFIVAAELDDAGADSRIFLAAPVQEEQLRQYLPELLAETIQTAWDERAKAVRSIRRERLGALTLKEDVVIATDRTQVLAALLQGVRLEGLGLLPWTPASRQLQARLQFMHRVAEWPDASDEGLLATLEMWLGPYAEGVKNAQQLSKLNLTEILLARLTWAERQTLDAWAPTHLEVPSGRRVVLDYSEPAAPVLAVKLQELFGALETPRLAGGRVPVTIHLLSPAGRPIQVTRDLASFWRTGYFDVKKDLKGRYPKHYWPEDPFQAVPTSRVRPREEKK